MFVRLGMNTTDDNKMNKTIALLCNKQGDVYFPN